MTNTTSNSPEKASEEPKNAPIVTPTPEKPDADKAATNK